MVHASFKCDSVLQSSQNAAAPSTSARMGACIHHGDCIQGGPWGTVSVIGDAIFPPPVLSMGMTARLS